MTRERPKVETLPVEIGKTPGWELCTGKGFEGFVCAFPEICGSTRACAVDYKVRP